MLPIITGLSTLFIMILNPTPGIGWEGTALTMPTSTCTEEAKGWNAWNEDNVQKSIDNGSITEMQLIAWCEKVK